MDPIAVLVRGVQANDPDTLTTLRYLDQEAQRGNFAANLLLQEVVQFNPHHGFHGRFSSADSSGSQEDKFVSHLMGHTGSRAGRASHRLHTMAQAHEMRYLELSHARRKAKSEDEWFRLSEESQSHFDRAERLHELGDQKGEEYRRFLREKDPIPTDSKALERRLREPGTVVVNNTNVNSGFNGSFFGELRAHNGEVTPVFIKPIGEAGKGRIGPGRNFDIFPSAPNEEQPFREEAAYRLNQMLGEPVYISPAVSREVEGHGMSSVHALLDGWGKFFDNKDATPEDKHRAGFFIALTAHLDAHQGNAMTNLHPQPGEPRLALIDFGWSFPDPSKAGYAATTRTGEFMYNAGKLTDEDNRYLQRMMDNETEIRAALEPLIGKSAMDETYFRARWMQQHQEVPKDFMAFWH